MRRPVTFRHKKKLIKQEQNKERGDQSPKTSETRTTAALDSAAPETYALIPPKLSTTFPSPPAGFSVGGFAQHCGLAIQLPPSNLSSPRFSSRAAAGAGSQPLPCSVSGHKWGRQGARPADCDRFRKEKVLTKITLEGILRIAAKINLIKF